MAKPMMLKELSRYPIGTYADIIYRNALLHPEKDAFVYGEERVSFARFNERVNSLVHGLQSLGLKKGDVIGILCWNCLECTDAFGAAMKGGFIASLLNPRLHPDELEYLINDSDVKAIFVGPESAENVHKLRPRLRNVAHYIAMERPYESMLFHDEFLTFSREEPVVNVEPSDPFIIFYTSGTTGVPRGAVYSHVRKLSEAKNKALQVGLKPRDRHIVVLPLFHIGGWTQCWAFFCLGASTIIMQQRSFEPEATFKVIQDEAITDIDIVPTQLVSMLASSSIKAYNLKSLERIWYAASPMPTDLLRRGIAVFGEVFAQGYGQSESGPDITILTQEAHRVIDRPTAEQKVLSSCGQPCTGVHVRIVDKNNNDVESDAVGEIIVKSNWIMLGYWKKPDETASTIVDGWLHTGDMGYYDEKGFIYIADRKKDMIISGGENVFPRQIEEILYRHPAVSEAAVIGVPDDRWVERVHAVITLRQGKTATAEEIIAFCKSHLAAYKAPKSVEFTESLPKNPQGKILKKVLRERWSQTRGQKTDTD